MEEKLERLRTMYRYARAKGHKAWMAQIIKDANKLKESVTEEVEDLYERAKEIFV